MFTFQGSKDFSKSKEIDSHASSLITEEDEQVQYSTKPKPVIPAHSELLATQKSSIKPLPSEQAELKETQEEHSINTLFLGATHLPTGSVTIGPSLLGKGAFGKVWTGQWGERQVALKEIDIKLAQKRLEITEEEALEALQWEVSRLSTLSHANLVQFYGLYQQEKHTYLVMEFCEGGSLQSVLEKQPNLDWSLRWQWALEITQGLAYLHHQGTLHRDLKAENVLLDKHQRARLADLGVAQVDALLQHNEAGVVAKGFQHQDFIATEVYKYGLSSTTAASDIYALGLVFWQLATQGEKPRHLSKLSIPEKGNWQHEVIPSDCPPAIKELILDCWQLEPSKRPSAEQIVERLNHLAANFHSKPDWVRMCEKADILIHPARSEVLKYAVPYATRHEVIEDLDDYWSRLENQGYQEREFKESQEEIKTNSEKMLTENPPLALTTILEDFLQISESSTLVLLGEAGLGKTLSTYQLADKLLSHFWQYLKNPQGTAPYYPLLIRPMLEKWSYSGLSGALQKAFENLKISLTETELKEARWLIIIDGYDECQADIEARNLSQQLGLQDFPNTKLLVTCRPKTVEALELQNRFALNGNLIIRHFLPFNVNQMLNYLKKSLCWDSNVQAQYQQKFEHAHDLRAVLRNPFVLSLLAQSWETTSQKDFSQLNRWQIYGGFVEHWINTRQFLLSNTLKKTLKGGHSTFLESFNAFAADMAFSAFQEGVVSLEIKTASEYSLDPWLNLKEQASKDSQQNFKFRQKQLTEKTQRRALLNEQDYNQIMLWRLQQFEAGSPLKNRILSFDFTHKSFFEYFISRRVVDLRNKEHGDIVKMGLTLLNARSLQEEPATLQFIAEAWQEPKTQVLKEPFFDIVRASRGNPQVAKAAADAISVLNAVDQSFDECDFQGIKIPGADLSFSSLQNTDLRYADLTRVNLSEANLKNANLQGAILHDAEFGEEPRLEYRLGKIRVLSPDKRLLAIVDKDIIYFLSLETKDYIQKVRMPKRVGALGRFNSEKNDLIHSIKFSQDCRFLAIRNSYFEIDILDITTWQFLSAFTGEVFEKSKEFVDFAISPDGKKIVISYNNGNWKLPPETDLIDTPKFPGVIRRKRPGVLQKKNKKKQEVLDIFDIETTKKIKTLLRPEYDPPITLDVDFNMGGGGYATKSLEFGKNEIGEPIIIKYSPKGNMVVVYDRAGNFLIWSEETEELIKDFRRGDMAHVFLEFSSSGDWFIYGSQILKTVDYDGHTLKEENKLHLEKIKDGKGPITIDLPSPVNNVSFSPDETKLALAFKDKIIILDLINLKIIWTLEEHTVSVNKLAFSSSGNFLVSTSFVDQILRLWDTRTGKFLRLMNLGQKTEIEEISFYQKDKFIISLAENICFRPIFTNVNRKKYPKTNDFSEISSIEFSKDGSFIVSGNKNGIVSVWQANTGSLKNNIVGHDKGEKVDYSTLALHGNALVTTAKTDKEGDKNNKILFAGCYEAYYTSDRNHFLRRAGFVIKLWDVLSTGQVKISKSINTITTLTRDGNEYYKSIDAFAVSYDSKWLAFSSSAPESVFGFGVGFNYLVELCSVETLAVVKSFQHEEPVRKLAFIPNTHILMTATDKSLNFWDITKGEILKIFSKQKTYITDLSVSQCGNYISTLDNSGNISIWSFALNKTIKSFKDSSMTCLCFSDNSGFLVSGHTNGSIKIWLIKNANVIYSTQVSHSEISSLAFNSVDSLFVTGSKNGLIICWKLRQIQKIITQTVDIVWSNRPLGLQCQGLKIEGIIAASTKNKEILHQNGALGVPSNQPYTSLSAFALIKAIKENNQEEFFRLLNFKAGSSIKKLVDEVDSESKGSPLYWAAAFGYVHFIDPLLKAGANIDKQDKDGRTPIYKAAQNGHVKAIGLLKAAGAAVDTRDNDGKTPIHAAAKKGYAAAVEILLDAGANAIIKTSGWFDKTALESAKRGKEPGHREVVRLLEAHLKEYPNGIKPVVGMSKEIFLPVTPPGSLEQKNPPMLAQFNVAKLVPVATPVLTQVNQPAPKNFSSKLSQLFKNG